MTKYEKITYCSFIKHGRRWVLANGASIYRTLKVRTKLTKMAIRPPNSSVLVVLALERHNVNNKLHLYDTKKCKLKANTLLPRTIMAVKRRSVSVLHYHNVYIGCSQFLRFLLFIFLFYELIQLYASNCTELCCRQVYFLAKHRWPGID